MRTNREPNKRVKEFRDCSIYYMPQRSDEWFDVRKGVLTASEFGAWLLPSKSGKPTKTQTSASQNAICRMISQKLGLDEAPNFDNWAMKRGRDLESASAANFEFETGVKLCPVGFCLSKHGAFGCSPDGLVFGQNAGFESKSPAGPTHVKYLQDGVLPSEYELQVHGSMAVTGADSWWFQSYCPGAPTFRILVERDQTTENLLNALRSFAGRFEVEWAPFANS